MIDLDRLLDASPNPHTRELLRAGRAETPPEQFSQHLLVSVSAAAVVGAVTSTATASLATATSTKLGGVISGAATSSVAAPSLALVAAKWVAVGVLGGGILATGADLALSRRREPASSARVVKVSVPRAPTPSLNVAAHSEPTPAEPAVESLVLPSRIPTATPATAPADASTAARSGQLGHEVELIDRVRRALSSGNTSLALSELDAFARVTKTGVLDREARVLRIQALRDAGDMAGAHALADQYLLDFPNDAHAARLRAQGASSKP